MEPFEIGYFDLPLFKPPSPVDEVNQRFVNIDFDGVDDGYLRFFKQS